MYNVGALSEEGFCNSGASKLNIVLVGFYGVVIQRTRFSLKGQLNVILVILFLLILRTRLSLAEALNVVTVICFSGSSAPVLGILLRRLRGKVSGWGGWAIETKHTPNEILALGGIIIITIDRFILKERKTIAPMIYFLVIIMGAWCSLSVRVTVVLILLSQELGLAHQRN